MPPTELLAERHTTEGPTVPARLRRSSTPTVIAVTVLAAAAVNVLIWAIGALAGGSFEFTESGTIQSAAPGGVIFLTAVPLTVGMTVAAVLALRLPGVIRLAQVVGSAAALSTIGMTLAADFDGVSTLALALTHVAIVPFLVVGLEAIRRRPVVGR